MAKASQSQKSAIQYGEELILLGSQLELNSDVFPNLDGGCAVAFYNGEGRVEVSIGPDGAGVDLRVEHGIGFAFDEVIPPTGDAGPLDVLQHLVLLKMFDKEIWKLSASSTFASSTDKASDFVTFYLGILQKSQAPRLLQTEKGGSQSSISLVPALNPV